VCAFVSDLWNPAIVVQNNEDVKVAVGRNFEEMVLDESKDTLLEVKICMHLKRRTQANTFL
jgi:hypothetical protein